MNVFFLLHILVFSPVLLALRSAESDMTSDHNPISFMEKYISEIYSKLSNYWELIKNLLYLGYKTLLP